ncbi:MAG: XcyI family restriction endonuclease [Chloroflexi bacterium]|nr:XcyI family restriction endonuclease [Chloroflexota bacterium]
MAFNPPPASRQLAFHERLVAARKRWLSPALEEALGKLDPVEISEQLASCAPSEVRQVLSAANIRDEYVFPTPVVLEAAPMLLGYYRLLLGRPQKSFYGKTKDGFGMFESMEMSGRLTEKQRLALPDLCSALGAATADLIRQLSPSVTSDDLRDLPLLTLGSQLQGANNNKIGREATRDVFTSMISIVEEDVESQTESRVVFRNQAGRRIYVTQASDPDVRVQEERTRTGQSPLNKLAIEIKGGTDASNAHNRAGEAEKSHIKAKREGYPECWTVIATKGVDMGKLKTESPTTNIFFDVAQILARQGEDWEEFESRLRSLFGI